MIKAVIFDIDGTLIDSNRQHAESFVKAFKKFGKDVPYEDLICLIGMGADLILEKFLSKDEIDDFGDELIEDRKNIFLEDFLPEVKVFPKLRELFEKLDSDKMQIALASSAGEEELEKYKKLLKISDLLDKETNADDADEAKPAPDIFEAAFDKLKSVEKNEVLIIGDTPYDAKAAKKADIEIFGVMSGGWSKDKLLGAGCEKVYRDIAEIFENYEKIFAK